MCAMMAAVDWRVAAEQALNSELIDLQPVGGGDFATAYCAQLQRADGQTQRLFIKTHANPPPGFFTTEAAGLAVLREAEAVQMPKVLSVSDEPPYLAMQWIEMSSSTVPDDPAFGRQLALLHNSSLPVFGREDARTTGSLALPNDPCHNWFEFYAQRRLLPLAAIAGERGSLPAASIEKLETIASRLSEFIDAPTMAARLHGDLWAGNRVWDDRGVSWLIDPAMHGGHPEFDLAMMRLFGGFDEICFDAYQEVSPLQAGWRDRIALHQLAPLVVHAIKFGSSYLPAVQRALDRYS
jgi:fructosamine-3-kinase